MNIECDESAVLDGELALLPIRNQVIFPGARQTIEVVRQKSVALVESLNVDAQPVIAVFQQKDLVTDSPKYDDLHTVGVMVRVLESQRHEGIGHVLTVEALKRVRGTAIVRDTPFLVASVQGIDEPADPAAFAELLASLRTAVAEVMPGFEPDLPAPGDGVDPGQLADLVGAAVQATVADKADLLATVDVAARLQMATSLVIRQGESQARLSRFVVPSSTDLKQFWPLESGAAERIERSTRKGDMTTDEGERIQQFIDRGYVIWEGLIDPELVDALVADVRSIRKYPGCFATTDHRRRRPSRISGPDFDHFENIFDTYVNFQSARQICFHPTILRFLELLFETRPVAFQQLLFQRSNEHPLHQDTAYVCLHDPLLMVASWIALEDVVRGRGELTYYEGSHRIPHYLYRDGSKRFTAGLDDADAARREILARCAAIGCVKRDFIAKKGDVFLWAADLLHGSNPRTRSEEETRMSCVTHYCPETTQPLWFWLHPELVELQPYGDRALIASSRYKLPHRKGVARPLFRTAEPC